MKKKETDSTSELFPEIQTSSSESIDKNAPLAVRMRPQNLDELAGQRHLLAEGKLLRRTLQLDRWTSMIFYGPPGSGKTTFANVISRMTKSHYKQLNAVMSNVAEIRRVIDEAKRLKRIRQKRTVVFIDEIHRFNKAQQDVLMPDVEQGNLVLVGATTHNPSFAINGPLLSRSIIFELKPLNEEEIISVLKRALINRDRGFGDLKVVVLDDAFKYLAIYASGDARRALNALEVGVLTTEPDPSGVIQFDRQVAEESCQRRVIYYDGDEDYHYDSASAFIKSMRGSDPDAAIFWLAKMLYAGEDPRFIIRRILILASEDIGNADPQALILASAGLQAIEFVGMPEARIILAQLVTYMALAPKSNASYMAIESAISDVESQKSEEVPNHLRDKSYSGAARLGHGVGYQYPHQPKDAEALKRQFYIPKNVRYYHPKETGFEKNLLHRLQHILSQKSPTQDK